MPWRLAPDCTRDRESAHRFRGTFAGVAAAEGRVNRDCLEAAGTQLDHGNRTAFAPWINAWHELHETEVRNLTLVALSYKMSYMRKMSVSVRELQQNLKRVMARVERGET